MSMFKNTTVVLGYNFKMKCNLKMVNNISKDSINMQNFPIKLNYYLTIIVIIFKYPGTSWKEQPEFFKTMWMIAVKSNLLL